MASALPAEMLRFLTKLDRNNNREWFQNHKPDFEQYVRDPLLQFIREFESHLHKMSGHFVADDRSNGGSLFRIYRDTRFSRDKTPYKTWAAVQFRHERAKDVHAPGFYLHIQPKQIFAGCGIWHPDGDAVRGVRDAIVEETAKWKRATRGKSFTNHFELGGESLKRPPRGYNAEHPMIVDLMRKDFVASAPFTVTELQSKTFVSLFAKKLKAATPFMEFLTKAVGLKW